MVSSSNIHSQALQDILKDSKAQDKLVLGFLKFTQSNLSKDLQFLVHVPEIHIARQ